MTNDTSTVGTPRTFGEWLRQQRYKHALTQQALADRLGYSVAMIRALEYGRRRPSRQILQRLREALPLPPGEQAFLTQLFPPEPSADQHSMHPVLPAHSDTHALPALPLTPLIGRDQLVAQIQATIIARRHRLLTLSGPPGVGKTRVARQVAHLLGDQFADEVVFLSLTTTHEPDLVLPMIAQAVGVQVQGRQSVLQALQTALHQRHLCLVLDNFEQLVPAAPFLADLLAAAPHLSMLVTSRAVLHVAGERVLPIPPLPTPRATDPLTLITSSPAVQLFVEHAQALNADQHYGEPDLRLIGQICRMLDGLPLAIVMVAAHSRVYTPQTFIAALASATLDVVNPIQRTEARHLSLRAAIAWSYDRVAPLEQRLFARLSVFEGGGTVAAIEQVCSDDMLGSAQVTATLEGLIDKGLVQYEHSARGTVRIVLLETLRVYAKERLCEQGAQEQICTQHAHYYADMVAQMDQSLKGAGRAAWLQWMEEECFNLHAALQSALAARLVELAGQLVVGLHPFWSKSGYLHESRRWIDDVLVYYQELPDPLQAQVLQKAGSLAYLAGEYTAAHEHLTTSLTIFRTLQDQAACAATLTQSGLSFMFELQYDAAHESFAEALELYSALEDTWGIVGALTGLGAVAFNREDPSLARTYHTQALAYARQLDNRYGESVAYANLGLVALYEAQYDEAQHNFRTSRLLSRELNETLMTARLLANEGKAACRAGNDRYAQQCLNESIAIWQTLGMRMELGEALQAVVELLAAREEHESAVWLLGAMTAFRKRFGGGIDTEDRRTYTQIVTHLRDALGAETFTEYWEQGRNNPLHDLLDIAHRYVTDQAARDGESVVDTGSPQRTSRTQSGEGVSQV